MTSARKNIPTLFRLNDLYLENVGHKGRGVFCRKPIKKGTVIEVTPAIILNEKETILADRTLLGNYTFMIGKISAKAMKMAGFKKPSDACSVVMGILTFCNHSDIHNAEIEWEEHAGTVYYSLKALKDIPAGVEICTSYGEGWFDDHSSGRKHKH